MTLYAGFRGIAARDIFLLLVSFVYKWTPAELRLATQCLRWVFVKGTHEFEGSDQQAGSS
jgi:hypothetical protein